MIELHNADCLDAMRLMEDDSFDLAIVDPPYGIERFKRPAGGTRFKCSKMMQQEGLVWDKKPSPEYFNELFRVSKNQIVWGSNNFTLPPSEYFCVWNKHQTVDNFASAELAYVSKGLKMPAKVFDFSIHKHNHTDKIHATQKPVALYTWLLEKYAKKGDRILDTHLGSGSIAIACHNLGYDLTGYELDKDYYQAACKRLENHQKQLRMF
jgi:site-specific DNA-methyltransferase (adenine-specific)